MSSPDMVVVDTEIIANAPVGDYVQHHVQARYLVAGMGDALATFVEARCSSENPLVHHLYWNHCVGRVFRSYTSFVRTGWRVESRLTALAIGEACTKTILKEGLQAIEISIP